MTVVVFSGPSLRASDRAEFPGFDFRPPVRQGELYAAAGPGVRVIALIDGYFDGVPAVWHKEVLWALKQGIAVCGAASMGALRAAELEAFGMTGIGRIFEDYRDGLLTDDDEVALLHGPEETGYIPLTEPMVNIRATVAHALSAGVLDEERAAEILTIAKAQFYQERSWGSVLAAANLPTSARDRFDLWLDQGRIDQKREDARGLLSRLAGQDFPPKPANFSFEWTEAWANAPWLLRQGQDDPDETRLILDELRMEGAAYLKARRVALLQMLARRAASGGEGEADGLSQFRLERGLYRQKDVDDWAALNGTDRAGVVRLASDQARGERLAQDWDGDLQALILDQIRLAGRYPALRERAQARRAAIAVGDGRQPPLPVLLAWYFQTRLGVPVPDDVDAYARKLGFADAGHFGGLIRAEFVLCATAR